jgi:hypothetical protein
MQPQGSGNINPQHIQNLTQQALTITVCADLQAFIDLVIPDIQVAIDAINLEISLLLPLINIPTDLKSVIQWISALAQFYIKPYLAYAEQLAALAAEITALLQALENVRIKIQGCQTQIPTITGLPG